MAWFRWHEGTSSDPKFHLIARKSGQPVAFALAIWAMLLERASAAEVRGDVSGFDCESADAALGIPDGATEAIFAAMVAKGMIVDDRIAKWEERQPKKEDATSTERVREHRARQKAKSETQCNEAQRQETPCNAVKHDETQCNETKRQETLDKSRLDKSIKENINIPPISPQGECEWGGKKPRKNTHAPEKPKTGEGDMQDDPGIEFTELREYWNEHMRPEGPLAGFTEYKALKKARDATGMSLWPGFMLVCEEAERRKSLGAWNPGYEPGLGKFLKERTWLAPMPKARASPLKDNGNGVTEQNMRVAARVLAKMQNETRGKLREIGDAE